jgi:hypothetical protein
MREMIKDRSRLSRGREAEPETVSSNLCGCCSDVTEAARRASERRIRFLKERCISTRWPPTPDQKPWSTPGMRNLPGVFLFCAKKRSPPQEAPLVLERELDPALPITNA